MLAVVSRDEIEAGKLAVGKATRADVKAYAQRMIDDHTKALRQLGDSAKTGGWTLPDSGMWGMAGNMVGNSRGSGSTVGSMGTSRDSSMRRSSSAMSAKDSAMQHGDEAMKLHAANVAAMQKLKAASASAFDALYVSTQIEGHDALLKALDKHPASAAAPKGLVAELRASVQSHLDAARKLQSNTSTAKKP